MDPADLDQLLDRELKQLPRPRAPKSLLPRVMEAAAEPVARPSTATGWSTWPRSWQIGAAAALALAVYAVSALITAPPAGAVEATRTAGEAATLVRVLWDVFLQPVATYMFVLGVALAFACAVAWAGFEVALGGASHR